MPAAVAAWAWQVAFQATLWGGTTLAVVAGAAYAVAAIGLSFALGAVSQALMGRPQGSANPALRFSVSKALTAARPIIYGEVTCGGVLVYQHTTGDRNQYLDFVIVVAGHQVESITDVWFDDVQVTNAQIGAGGDVTTGELGPKNGQPIVYVWKYLGTAGQTASPQLSTADGTGYGPTTWTTSHRLRGCAYVHIRLRRGDYWEKYGAPSNFRFRVKGAKVYDPRLDTTNGGSGSQRLDDASTWTWSNNPALCQADYLAGGSVSNDVATPLRKRGFAVKAPATDIDWDAVIASANICDELVSIPGSTTQKRYTCDIVVVPSDDTPDAECMDQLLSANLGQLTYTAGEYVLHAGAYSTPVYTLDEDDLAGDITYVSGKGRSERYNFVRGVRYDLTTGQETEFLSRTDSSYVTADGATLYHDIELPATSDEYRAQRIAQVILRRSREMETIVWQGMPSAAKIAVWETVSVTVAELGLSSKVFRCIARKRRLGSGGEPVVELTLREENSSTYTDPAVGDYGSISVATDPGPASVVVEEPTGLTATSLPNGILLTITPSTNAPTSTVYEVFEYTSSTPFSSATRIWYGAATTFIHPRTDTTQRYYWVRARENVALSDEYPTGAGVPGKAASASTALSASVTASTVTATGTGSTVTSSSVTVTPSGGTNPYTYAWTVASGSGVSAVSNTAATTTFQATGLAAGGSATAVMRCTVTDNVAATFTVDVNVTLSRSASGALTVSASSTNVTKTGLTSSLTTASVTVTPSGGTGPYTYSWVKQSGDTITADSTTAATTTFSATGLASPESRTAVFRCTATDSASLTASVDVTVTIDRNSYA